MSFQNIKKHFPVVNQCIYANTAAIGLLSDELLEWRQEHDLDFLIGGADMKMESFNMISDVKQTVGDFFGCKRDDVALIPNFSLGLNIILEGLDVGHKILLLEKDYPSVNWPFESRDFPISYVKIDEHLEANIEEELRTGAYTVLALSLVQWDTGIKIDLDFLKRIKATYPEVLIIADGTQFCGAFDFDFQSSGIDVLGVSAYKWLLAGTGNGFMLFSKEAQTRLKPKASGFNSVNGNLKAKGVFRFVKHLEPGHLDSLCFGSLDFSLKMLLNLGLKNIEEHNRGLMKKAFRCFGELGLLKEEVLQRKDHSTIFNIQGDDALFDHLASNNVSCSQRGGGIRLSFHIYNDEKDIDRIADILKSAPGSLTTFEK
jgi:selenocysteine lyase/cysteine desulfurase